MYHCASAAALLASASEHKSYKSATLELLLVASCCLLNRLWAPLALDFNEADLQRGAIVEIAGIRRWERLSYNHPNQLHGSGVVLITIHLLFVKILKTSKSHFAIGSDPIESKALHYHYLDLPILRTSADLEYYHSHSIDFFLIVLHLSDHMIISCCHPGCLTMEYTFVFIVIFSYLSCFTFSSVFKSVLPFVLVQF